MTKVFPVIDLAATGENIVRLRKERGLTVRDLQNWFGFEEPQAIYKWQRGKSLPTVDNLYALGMLLDVPMEEILVPCRPQLNIVKNGQQEVSCCPPFLPGSFEYGRTGGHVTIFAARTALPPDPGGESRAVWGDSRKSEDDMQNTYGWRCQSGRMDGREGEIWIAGVIAGGWWNRWGSFDHPAWLVRAQSTEIQVSIVKVKYAALWFICT